LNIGFVGSKFGFTPEQMNAVNEICKKLTVKNIYGGYSYISDFQLKEILKCRLPTISFIDDKDMVLKQDLLLVNPQRTRIKDPIIQQSIFDFKKDKKRKKIIKINSDGTSEEL
jgi:hypothetical protein